VDHFADNVSLARKIHWIASDTTEIDAIWWHSLLETASAAQDDAKLLEAECERKRDSLMDARCFHFVSPWWSSNCYLIAPGSKQPTLLIADECNSIDTLTLQHKSPHKFEETLIFTLDVACKLRRHRDWATLSFSQQGAQFWISIDYSTSEAKVYDGVVHRSNQISMAEKPHSSLSIDTPMDFMQFRFVIDRVVLASRMYSVDLSKLTVSGWQDVYYCLDALSLCLERSSVRRVDQFTFVHSNAALPLNVAVVLLAEVFSRGIAATLVHLDLRGVVLCSSSPQEVERFCALLRDCTMLATFDFSVGSDNDLLYDALVVVCDFLSTRRKSRVFPFSSSAESAALSIDDRNDLESESNATAEEAKAAAAQLYGTNPTIRAVVDPARTARLLWGAEEAMWQLNKGAGVRVAVLDTGVDVSHPTLRNKVVACESFVDDEPHAWLDGNGHGTACADIIAGCDGGIAPDCSLFVGKVVSNSGVGTVDSLVRGIEWALSKRCVIISLSVGTETPATALLRAIAKAQKQGVHVVCAAANVGSSRRANIAYPARFGHVLCVGCCDDAGNTTFSSTGREIDFVAYGEDISAAVPGKLSPSSHTGTSFAVPAVAGIIAILHAHFIKKFARPLNCAEMKALLVDMCAHPGAHNARDGYGLLQQHRRYFNAAWLADSFSHILTADVVDVLFKLKKTKKQRAIEAAAAAADEAEHSKIETACEKFGIEADYELAVSRYEAFRELGNNEPPIGQRCSEFGVALDILLSVYDEADVNPDYRMDLGFENVPGVDRDSRDSFLAAADLLATENVDWGPQFSTLCDEGLRPMDATVVSFDKRPMHFGYAVVFVRCVYGRRKTRLTLLMGAANGDREKIHDITPASGSSKGASASCDHTEKRIVARLYIFLRRLHESGRWLVRDIFVHFFTQVPICHTCDPNIRNFFLALEAGNIVACSSARFSRNSKPVRVSS
jgi:hypothetical protein